MVDSAESDACKRGFTPEEGSAFDEADTLFRGCVISVLAENLVDSYVLLPTGKELWDALEAQYGVSDAGSELYAMEQFLDYRKVEDRSVVEHAHEIHTLAKVLKNCSKESPYVCYPISLWPEVLSLSYHLLGGTLLLL